MENKYFEKMEAVIRQYNNMVDLHKEEREKIIDSYGFDSEEMSAWRDIDQMLAKMCPYTNGQGKAFRAWRYSTDEEFCMDDWLSETEAADFVNTLREAGIKEFGYYNSSSAVMEDIHLLIENGCELVGAITRTVTDWNKEKTVKGLKFRIAE